VLVRYGFDDDAVETGPDTFAVFRAAHGRVASAPCFRHSGYRSVEIRDVPGNGDFSELQGYFPEQRTGHVFAHFALLTARPEEELTSRWPGRSVSVSARRHRVLAGDARGPFRARLGQHPEEARPSWMVEGRRPGLDVVGHVDLVPAKPRTGASFFRDAVRDVHETALARRQPERDAVLAETETLRPGQRDVELLLRRAVRSAKWAKTWPVRCSGK